MVVDPSLSGVHAPGSLRRRSDRVAIAAGVVGSGSPAFAANGFRCPLTQVAERIDAERGSVTDIYLPRWFAHTCRRSESRSSRSSDTPADETYDGNDTWNDRQRLGPPPAR